MPKYSVIIPAYNASKHITKALSSLENQTVENSLFEVIIVDDGSKDNTEKVCRKYIDKCPNVRYFKTPNGGTSHARNFGIKKATGDFIVFLDSDDWVDVNFFETIDKNIDGSDYYIHAYACNYKNRQIDVSIPEKIIQMTNNMSLAKQVLEYDKCGFFSAVCIGVYRRDIIIQHLIEFPLNLRFGEDPSFTYQYILWIKSLKYIDMSLYHYNKCNENSLTSNYVKDRYPLCKERFAYRRKVYDLYGSDDILEYNIQYAKSISIEILACVINDCKFESKMTIREIIRKMKIMFCDSDIMKWFGLYFDNYSLDSKRDQKSIRFLIYAFKHKSTVCCYILVLILRLKNHIFKFLNKRKMVNI